MPRPYNEFRTGEVTRVYAAEEGPFARRVSAKNYKPNWSFQTDNYPHRNTLYVSQGELFVREQRKEHRLTAGWTLLAFDGCDFELFTREQEVKAFCVFNSAMHVKPTNSRCILLEPSAQMSTLAQCVLASLAATGRYALDLTLTAGDSFAAMGYHLAADRFEHPRTRASEWLKIARKLIDANADTNRSLREILKPLPLSYEHFLRMFKAEWGVSPHAWRIRKRVSMARELLTRSQEDVTVIAAQLGYSSSQHFATEFRRITGMTPSAFRDDARSAGTSRSTGRSRANR
jgi:AraC-like DNA-binding protein